LRLQPPARTIDELQDQLDRWREHYNRRDPSGTRRTDPIRQVGDLEYADEVTLGRAFEGRRAVDV
jgi:recombinational DNA repair protein RecR